MNKPPNTKIYNITMNKKAFYILITVFAAAGIIFLGFIFDAPAPAETLTITEEKTAVTMYRSEGCNCCVKWAEYLEENGFRVTDEKVADLYQVKQEKGIPAQLSSCHTAIVDGYVVEGHVPAEDIRRLLSERPDAIGISAPGMPPNSPGMDIPVTHEYQIILFDEAGDMSVYATHN